MRWVLDISDPELIDQIGTILFTVILPDNKPDLFAQIQEDLMSGKLTYTVNEIKDDVIIMNIIEHPDVAKYNLDDTVFKTTRCLQINPNGLSAHNFLVLYDPENYLFLIKIDDNVYKFNFGFYSLLLNLNSYSQALGLGDLLNSLDTEKLLDEKSANNSIEDDDTASDLVM